MKNFFFFGKNKFERMISMKRKYKILLIVFAFLSLFAIKFLTTMESGISTTATFI